MKIRTWVCNHDLSDPLDEFCQVAIFVDRDDGKTLTWRGERIPHARGSCGFSVEEALASAVAAMLADTTVLKFVGMFKK